MIINVKLLSHPLNWITITLMLIIAAAFGHLAISWVGLEPATKDKTSSYNQLPAGISQLTVAQKNS